MEQGQWTRDEFCNGLVALGFVGIFVTMQACLRKTPVTLVYLKRNAAGAKNLKNDNVRHFRRRVQNLYRSEARKQCFLTSDWLQFGTLPQKNLTLFKISDHTQYYLHYRCDSIDKLKQRVTQLDNDIKQPARFKEFYQYVFNFAKDAGSKNLSKLLSF